MWVVWWRYRVVAAFCSGSVEAESMVGEDNRFVFHLLSEQQC